MEEIPQELAINRTLGERIQLRGDGDADGGTTVLEHGQYFTLPAGAAGYFDEYEQQHRLYCRQYVERVKAFLERQSGYPMGSSPVFQSE